MQEQTARVFNIQRFSTHDGPGIRTVVFLKGCSLACQWCMNPESISKDFQIMYEQDKCMLCGYCVKTAGEHDEKEAVYQHADHIVFDREKIKDAGVYRNVCPTEALTVVGEDRSITDIMKEVRADIPFFTKSGGGLTVSGGEPYTQAESVAALFQEARQAGISTCVETSLYVSFEQIRKSLPYTDYILADIKHVDPYKYKAGTGGNLQVVLNNLRALSEFDGTIRARVPVIPGFNDTYDELNAIIAYVSELPHIRAIDFLSYHTLGKAKYTYLGGEYNYPGIPEHTKHFLEEFIQNTIDTDLTVTIGG